MSLLPTDFGVAALIGLSTGLFLLLVVSTLLVRFFWSLLARNTDRPRPTMGKSLLVATAGGLLFLPFFLLLDPQPVEKEPMKVDPNFRITGEEERTRRAGIESFRNHLRMLDRSVKDEKALPHPTRHRSRDVRTIPHASGMQYAYHPEASAGLYIAMEPDFLDGKRHAVRRDTFTVVELPEGGTK